MSRAAKAKPSAPPASDTRPRGSEDADGEWIRENFDDTDHAIRNLLQLTSAVQHLRAEANGWASLFWEQRGTDLTEDSVVEEHAAVAHDSLCQVTDVVFRLREALRERLPKPGKASAEGGAS